MFLSFCFEYRRFVEFMNKKDVTVFYTYLPIELDASCNGYQHLVLFLLIKLLNKLNLSNSTHDDDPDDFYTYILEKAYSYIKANIKNIKTKKVAITKKYYILHTKMINKLNVIL